MVLYLNNMRQAWSHVMKRFTKTIIYNTMVHINKYIEDKGKLKGTIFSLCVRYKKLKYLH